VNTIAATTRRVPRVALIGIVALGAAFALLMVVRAGVLGGSTSVSKPLTTPTRVYRAKHARSAAKPQVVILPGLPPAVTHALRYSEVVVVSLYSSPAPGDYDAVAQALQGARAAGAGFAAVNVVDTKNAPEVASFVGDVSTPAMLVVRRPGTIVTRIDGVADAAVVRQAVANARAGR